MPRRPERRNTDPVITKLDTAVMKTADLIVLWLWDTFGVKHMQQFKFVTVLIIAAAALSASFGGQKYGLMFWVLWPTSIFVYTLVYWTFSRYPPEVHNALAARRRGVLVVALLRWVLPASAAASGLATDHLPPATPHYVNMTFWAAFWLWDVWGDAMSPTRPRKTRHMTLGIFAPQGSAS